VHRFALLTVAFALLARSSSAAPATRLVYSREPGAEKCADDGALRSAVAARLGYDPFFPWAKTTLVANVQREGGAYRAHIALLDDKGLARGTRDLVDTREDCAELLPAMALGISIALDMLDPRPPAPPPPEPKRPEDEPPPPEPEAPQEPEAPRAPAPPPSAPLRIEVGVDGVASAGVLPAPAPGFDAFGRVRAAAWSLGLEVGADAPVSKQDRFASTATVTVVGGAVVPCVHVRSLGLCGLAYLGVLHASSGPESATSALPALGVRVTTEVPLSERLRARLHGDLISTLSRPTLRLDNLDLWTAYPAAGRLGLGLVYRF
jgi:hypothetical protein